MAGKIWRVGLMGHAANKKNVLLFLGAMDAVLGAMNAPVVRGVAVDSALAFYASA